MEDEQEDEAAEVMLDCRNIECDNDVALPSPPSPKLVSRVRILPLDTIHTQPRFQAITPGNKRFEIDDCVRRLLVYVQVPRSVTDLLATAERNRWQDGGVMINLPFIERKLIKTGLVEYYGSRNDVDSGTTPGPAASGSGYAFLWLRRDLLGHKTLQPATKALAVLLSPVGILLGMSFSIVTHTIFLAQLWRGAMPAMPSAQGWWMMVGLLYASVFWHELGHASACERFGVEHGPIGVGVYFTYPVLYCNVTEAWKLPRMQRVVVDSAGVYFHCLFASVFCIVALRLPSPVFPWLIASVWFTILFNLNPFLKFDGYWILTDLLGLSSLHRISAAVLRRVALLDRDPRSSRELRELPRMIRFTVLSYSVLYAGVTAYFTERIVRAIIPSCVRSLTHDLPAMLARIEAKQIDVILLAQAFQVVLILLCTYGGVRFLLAGITAIIRRFRRT